MIKAESTITRRRKLEMKMPSLGKGEKGGIELHSDSNRAFLKERKDTAMDPWIAVFLFLSSLLSFLGRVTFACIKILSPSHDMKKNPYSKFHQSNVHRRLPFLVGRQKKKRASFRRRGMGLEGHHARAPSLGIKQPHAHGRYGMGRCGRSADQEAV